MLQLLQKSMMWNREVPPALSVNGGQPTTTEVGVYSESIFHSNLSAASHICCCLFDCYLSAHFTFPHCYLGWLEAFYCDIVILLVLFLMCIYQEKHPINYAAWAF